VLALAIHMAVFAGASVDDAYISYVYARNLAQGHGLRYDPAGPAVEGYSNFLWTLLHVPATLVPDPIILSKVLGALILVATLFAAHRGVHQMAPEDRAAPWLAVLFLAASPAWVYWHFTGLETPLVALALLSAFLAASRPTSRHAARWEAVA